MALIPLFIIVPLIAAVAVLVLGRIKEEISSLVASLGAISIVVMACFSLTRETLVYKVGGWGVQLGGVLVLDGLSALMLLIISCVGLAVVIFSVPYMDRFTDKPKYFALLFLLISGLSGVVLSGDLFNLFIFMEIAALSSYALIAFGTEAEELEATIRYMILGAIASSCIMLSIAIIYSITGTLNLALISQVIKAVGTIPPLKIAFALLLTGFSLKAALVPFHAWLPDAHTAAPAPISAMLSGVVIKAVGIYSLSRLFFNVFGMTPVISEVLMVLGALSMVLGGLLASSQWDLKRMFAYSTISQIGYVALGLGIGTPIGILGALFHLLNHASVKSLLFLTSGSIDHAAGTRDLRKMGGLKSSMPVTWLASMLASMSVAGVPPLGGFWSKLIIIFAAASAGRYFYAFLAVVVSIITLGYFLKAQKYAYFGKLREEHKGVKESPALMCASMAALAIVCVALGVLFPYALTFVVEPAADVLIKGVGYSLLVIGG